MILHSRAGFLANLAAAMMKAECLLVYEVGKEVISDTLIGGSESISPEHQPGISFEAESVQVVCRGGERIQGWRYAA